MVASEEVLVNCKKSQMVGIDKEACMTGLLRKIPIVSAFVPPEQPRVAPQLANLIRGVDPKAAQEAAAEKRKKLRRGVGREATIRTSPLGATAPAGSVARKTLLGQ